MYQHRSQAHRAFCLGASVRFGWIARPGAWDGMGWAGSDGLGQGHTRTTYALTTGVSAGTHGWEFWICFSFFGLSARDCRSCSLVLGRVVVGQRFVRGGFKTAVEHIHKDFCFVVSFQRAVWPCCSQTEGHSRDPLPHDLECPELCPAKKCLGLLPGSNHVHYILCYIALYALQFPHTSRTAHQPYLVHDRA